MDLLTGLLMQGAAALLCGVLYCCVYSRRLRESQPRPAAAWPALGTDERDRMNQALGYSEALLQVLGYMHKLAGEGKIDGDGPQFSVVATGLYCMLAGHEPDDGREPGFFVVEYLVRSDYGNAILERRPLAEWPSWANNLTGLLEASRRVL